jgi:hypothetical protein
MNRKTMIWAALALVALVTVTYAAGSMTVTGSVVSTSVDQLVVRAADGEKSFVVDDNTMKPADLVIGTKVNVTYHEMNGRMVATQVAAVQPSTSSYQSETSASSTATTSSSTSGAYAPPAAGTTEPAATASAASDPAYAPQAQSSDPAAQESQESTVAATDADDDLPATGSRLPLLALLGLGAGAGALVLRRVH